VVHGKEKSGEGQHWKKKVFPNHRSSPDKNSDSQGANKKIGGSLLLGQGWKRHNLAEEAKLVSGCATCLGGD